jgi:hypothetical protein
LNAKEQHPVLRKTKSAIEPSHPAGKNTIPRFFNILEHEYPLGMCKLYEQFMHSFAYSADQAMPLSMISFLLTRLVFGVTILA